MSRLIVKNIPKGTTEEDLRKLFSQKGTITDVQLKYTPQGKFRQFAFIGYQNDKDAEEAIKYFDKMCINTSRLSVAHCTPLGSAQKPKAWSKHSSEKKSEPLEIDKPNYAKREKGKVDLLEKYKSDPVFKEFMSLHVPKQSEALDEFESREHDAEEVEAEEQKEEEIKSAAKVANLKISDSDYMKSLMGKTNENSAITNVKSHEKIEQKYTLFTVKLKGLPYNCKKKDVKKFFSPLVPFTIRLPPKIKGIAYAGFKEERNMNKALLKNKSFLEGKRIFVAKYVKHEEKEESNQKKCPKWKNEEEALKNEESIAESGRIFIRNLPYTVAENNIQELFEKYGPLSEINVPIDVVTRKLKGFATVTYLMPDHAVRAYTELDGSIFHGRMLHLLPGKAKDEDAVHTEESSNYKKKKQAQQKIQAGSSHNWNSLFLGHNAVAEVIADSYGVSKEDVLTPHGDGSAAVRLALGETQIVASTRKYLEDEGVLLDAFNSPNCERSKTVILVKNLPSKTEVTELRKLFDKFGVIGRVILPPSGITAIIEFMEPSEAKAAFTKLAYSKFKNMPLYLEWAPKDSLTVSATKTEKSVCPEEKKVEVESETEEAEEGTTIFVKNLNFETTDEALRKHFESCGKLKYAKVARKKNKNDPQKQLSMGFGFVQYILKTSADAALKNLQQSQLDGKSLELKRSERTLKDEIKTSRKIAKKEKQTGTKILVRNVPFQANRNEILELFKTFGEIKALRMPKKISADSHSHRGFAFVDFTTENDAKAAFDALCQSTHLYGRRLVLEWAATEENVEQIRKRTAEHFKPQDSVKNKKSVFNASIE